MGLSGSWLAIGEIVSAWLAVGDISAMAPVPK
jgi:hypothetical protein